MGDKLVDGGVAGYLGDVFGTFIESFVEFDLRPEHGGKILRFQGSAPADGRNLPKGRSNFAMMFRDLLSLFKASTPTDERRETIRLNCSIGVLAKTKKGQREARVVNASLTGLCLELESKIKPKTELSLHRPEHGDPLTAKVIWCRSIKGSDKWHAGVNFGEDKSMLKSSWLKPALKDLGFSVGRISEKRKLLRVPGSGRCFLKSMAGETYGKGSILNLSAGGALVESEVELPRELRIRFKTNPLPGGIDALRAVAEVRSVKRNPKTRMYLTGLRFTEVDEKLLRKHMAAMMAEL